MMTIFQTMNSIDNNIQFTCEVENIRIFAFLETFFPRTDEGFSTSVNHKNCTILLPPHAGSWHLPSQKTATFYLFINHALNICSDPISFNSEIQYLKANARDKGYNSSTVHKALF